MLYISPLFYFDIDFVMFDIDIYNRETHMQQNQGTQMPEYKGEL
jgi:hypothetical protein